MGLSDYVYYLVNLHIGSSPFHLATAQSQCLMVTERDGGLSSLYYSWGFACQQRVLKTLFGGGYLRFEDEID